MRFAATACALALAAVVAAQDPVVVRVGEGPDGQPDFKFNPQFVTITQPNTVVTFQFVALNHSVSQSSFATPCEPLDGGFNSGFVPVGDGQGTWNLTVTDVSQPIWFYCPQQAIMPFHCTAGMVGAINANVTGQDPSAFVAAALAATTIVIPTPALSGVNAFATLAPTVSTAAGAASTAGASATATAPGGSASIVYPSTSAGGASTLAGGGSATQTGAPAPMDTSNAASTIYASGLYALLAAALGMAVL